MKLTMVFAVYLLFGALMAFSVVKAVAGQPWWLAGCVVAFLAAFVRFGCRTH